MTMTAIYERAGTEQDLEACAVLLSAAFGGTLENSRAWVAKGGSDDLRVLRVGSEVVATLRFIPMGQWFGGRSVRMIGIAGVAVAPQHRGHGYARRLMEEAVREMAGMGCPISGLYPATQTLYRRAGWEQAGTRSVIRIPSAKLKLADPPTAARDGLRGVKLTADDQPRVKALYERYARRRDGYLDRGPYIWQRVFDPYTGPMTGYGFERDGELCAYVYLRNAKKPTGRYDVELSDLAAADAAGMRAVLGLLADHRSVGDDIEWCAGPCDPWLHLLDEQPYEVKLLDYWMLRIIDVPRALESRGYGAGLRGELHFDVRDELVPKNNGRFVLTVEGGAGRVSPGGEGSLRLGVRALASLYTGFRPASDLRLLGQLEGPDDAVCLADALFAGPTPITPDMY